MLPVSSVPMYLDLASARERSVEAAPADGAVTTVKIDAATAASATATALKRERRCRGERRQGDMGNLRNRLGENRSVGVRKGKWDCVTDGQQERHIAAGPAPDPRKAVRSR